jgi:DNA-binding Lrp family transcriptional regulator
MPSSQPRLKQITSLPISWVSEGKLKSSLLLRHATKGRTSEALELLSQEKFSANRVESLFPSLREPERDVLERASQDYLRCILARSVAQVYAKSTPKYRNEAARKQFFKRLLEAAEGCHLSDSFSRLEEIRATEEDRIFTWVKTEIDSLARAKTDLTAEHTSKLNIARVEFRACLRDIEEITGVHWEDSDRYQPSLAVTSFFPPGIVESEESWRWGAQWLPERGILNINPPILFMDTVRRGVLAREAAALLSPKNMDNMEHGARILSEQSEYFGYKLLDHKDDKEYWSQARHGLRKSTRVGTQDLLIDFFQYYEMMVGPNLYRDVWSRLKEVANARLTVADYYIIFNTLAARPVRQRFNANEMKLLTLLSKKPQLKAGEAARILHISIPTTMKAIDDLSSKSGLRFSVIVNMNKLGLTEYLILLNSSRQSHVVNALSRFPFCRQVFRTYGSYDVFCVLDIPKANAAFAASFIGGMRDQGMIAGAVVLELERDFQNVNFDRYDAEVGRWEVHWDSWGISLRESLSKADAFRSGRTPDSSGFQADKLDLMILRNLHSDCRMPHSAIGRALGVSGAYVGKKIERMLRENVFRYAVWPLKIGAEDWGIVSLACNIDVSNVVARYLSHLPAWRGGLVHGDYDGILAMVWSPSGEMKQFFKAIDDRLIRQGHAQARCLSVIGEWVIARWLPVDPYPWELISEKGEWIFDERRYLQALQK